MSDELNQLKKDINQLRKNVNGQLDELSHRIDCALIDQISVRLNNEKIKHQPIIHEELTASADAKANSNADVNVNQEALSAMPSDQLSSIERSTANQIKQIQHQDGQQQQQDSKPSIFSQLLLFVLSLFSDVLQPVSKIYQSYQARNMGGIFIITLIGIALTLSGVGYLMQMMIEQLGVGAKVLLFAGVSLAVIAVGIYLRLKTSFDEFATAIVATGLLIAYTTVYFAGSVFGVLNQIATIGLYLFIALSCHGFALWLNTKVLACLGIVGIAAMPILSPNVAADGSSYLISLALATVSTLWISYKKQWQWLANINLALVFLALEYNLLSEQHVSPIDVELISSFTHTLTNIFTNAFYLAFFAYAGISLYKRVDQLANKTLLMLCAAIGSSLLLFYQLSTPASHSLLAILSLVNAAAALSLAVLFYKVANNHYHSMVLIAAAWAVVFIMATLSTTYWGMAFALEGLLLMTFAKRLKLTGVFFQGQGLALVATVYNLVAILPHFPSPALETVDGWALALVIAATLAIWLRLQDQNQSDNQNADNNTGNDDTVNLSFVAAIQRYIKPILQFSEALWLATLTIATMMIYLGDWAGCLVIAVQFLLLLRARYCKHIAIEILAIALFSIPFIYGFIGALEVGAFRFSALPWFAKLAMISAFLQLYLWQSFNRKFNIESPLNQLAALCRIGFYALIPIIWIKSSIRVFDEEFIQLLWLSPLLALALAVKIKHQFLIIEAKLLSVLTGLALIVLIGFVDTLSALIALVGFSITGLVAFQLKKNQLKKKQTKQTPYSLKTTNKLSFVMANNSWKFIAIASSIFIGFFLNSVLMFTISASLMWATAFVFERKSLYLRASSEFIKYANLLVLLFSWFSLLNHWLYTIPATITLTAIIVGTMLSTSAKDQLKLGANYDLALHSGAAITYILALISIGAQMTLLIGPALAIHGVYILMKQDGRLTQVRFGFAMMLIAIAKLALFDAANALLWQKVMLFIGVGVFLLFAAFWYQKLIARMEAASG